MIVFKLYYNAVTGGPCVEIGKSIIKPHKVVLKGVKIKSMYSEEGSPSWYLVGKAKKMCMDSNFCLTLK